LDLPGFDLTLGLTAEENQDESIREEESQAESRNEQDPKQRIVEEFASSPTLSDVYQTAVDARASLSQNSCSTGTSHATTEDEAAHDLNAAVDEEDSFDRQYRMGQQLGQGSSSVPISVRHIF
jgi:hypothetical protein